MMILSKRLAVVLVLALFSFAPPAFAQTTLQVFLWDMGTDVDMLEGHKIADQAPREVEPMGIAANTNTVAAGEITFNVLNASDEMIHEMVVARLPDETGALPFNVYENRVDEDAITDFGEVSELEPGDRGQLSVTLEPGTYVLLCNIPGHYASGMWMILTVE